MRAGELMVLNPSYFWVQITDFGADSDAKSPLPGAKGRMSCGGSSDTKVLLKPSSWAWSLLRGWGHICSWRADLKSRGRMQGDGRNIKSVCSGKGHFPQYLLVVVPCSAWSPLTTLYGGSLAGLPRKTEGITLSWAIPSSLSCCEEFPRVSLPHKFLLIMLHPSKRNPSQFGFSSAGKWSARSAPPLLCPFLGFPRHQPNGLKKKNHFRWGSVITTACSGWEETFTSNSRELWRLDEERTARLVSTWGKGRACVVDPRHGCSLER